MPANPLEITATFLSEKFRFSNADGDTIIGDAWMNGEVSDRVTIKGQADLDELRAEQTYRFYGHWTSYRNKRTGQNEKQFAFTSFILQQPHGRAGVVQYLRAAGEGLGLGLVRCNKLWELYGSEAVEALRIDPAAVAARLSEFRGLNLSKENAEKIAAVLQEQAALEGCTLDLMELFHGRGFRKLLPRWLMRDHGNQAANVVRENPFEALIAKGYAGCSFKLVDALWLHLKLPADSIIRQAYCVLHAIESEQEGSTWIPRAAAEQALKASIGSADVRASEAIQYAIDAGLIVQCATRGPNGPIAEDGSGNIAWLATKQNAEIEIELAKRVADKMAEPHWWPDVSEIENIDDGQPEVLRKALQGSIAILGGRPGSGKTFTAANLVKLLIAKYGEENIGIGAPTNLAAQRLSQVMAGYGVTIKATTNHRMLGRPRVRGEEWNHNERNKLPFKVLIFDEESMKDARMMLAIFRAIAVGTLVLLIGDINQLLPVDRGAPLRDFIAAGLPYGELTKIRRASGGIVEACAAIAEGKRWGPGDNLQIIEVDDEAGQAAAVIEQLHECQRAGFHPVWDSRIIVAKNETRRKLNKIIQGQVNDNPPVDGTPFRVADKVICRDNVDYKLVSLGDGIDEEDDIEFDDSGNQVRISNGELGKVLEIGEGYMIVGVMSPKRVVRVPLGKVFAREHGSKDPGDDGSEGEEKDKTGTGCAFDLAYAVTFHSCQGSEFPWPILVASTRDGFMGSRELTYTGISRGKNMVKMIGKKAVWDRFCRKIALGKRKTFLRERILLEVGKRELAEL